MDGKEAWSRKARHELAFLRGLLQRLDPIGVAPGIALRRAALALMLSLAACAQNHPYRMTGSPATGWELSEPTPLPPTTDLCPERRRDQRALRRGKDAAPSVEWAQHHDGADLYQLGFAEIDDHVNEFEPKQLQHSLEALEPPDDAGIIMITFVHGWNHNANACDGNVRNLRLTLAELADREAAVAKREGRPPRHVRGMFIGWRGLSFQRRNPLTFWARKHGAHRVGERAAISVFTRIQRFAERSSARAPDSRFVTVGHSFGGAVVHTALEAVLVPQLSHAAEAARLGEAVPQVSGLGQITVLVNPAFEAARYRHSFELSREIETHGGFHPDQKPVLLVLTSRRDRATRRLFTMGMRMRSHRGRFITDPRGDEKKEYLTAVGHHEPYWTKDVELVWSEGMAQPLAVETEFFADDGKSMARAKEPATCRIEDWQGRGPMLSVYDHDGELMSSHNDVFNRRLQDLLWTFVRDIEAPPLVGPVPELPTELSKAPYPSRATGPTPTPP